MPSAEFSQRHKALYVGVTQVPAEALRFMGDDYDDLLTPELEKACDAAIEQAKRELRILNDGRLPPAETEDLDH